MKQLINWFSKKKISLSECSSFEVSEEQADKFFGGFKEYKPPIYEHESALTTKITISDLIMETHRNQAK